MHDKVRLVRISDVLWGVPKLCDRGFDRKLKGVVLACAPFLGQSHSSEALSNSDFFMPKLQMKGLDRLDTPHTVVQGLLTSLALPKPQLPISWLIFFFRFGGVRTFGDNGVRLIVRSQVAMSRVGQAGSTRPASSDFGVGLGASAAGCRVGCRQTSAG